MLKLLFYVLKILQMFSYNIFLDCRTRKRGAEGVSARGLIGLVLKQGIGCIYTKVWLPQFLKGNATCQGHKAHNYL